MHISVRSDYAIQAMLAIAWLDGGPVTASGLADILNIPASYLPPMLSDLRRAGLVRGRTGLDGGYSLARPLEEITIGAVMRAVEGTLASIRGRSPRTAKYHGAAAKLPAFWQSVHVVVNSVLDSTTLADLLTDVSDELSF